jgi:hypothetical protein
VDKGIRESRLGGKPAAAGHRARRSIESRMFSACAIGLLVLSTVGFIGSGIAKTQGGLDLTTPRFVLHGVAGFLWLALFVVQTQLVLRKRISAHRAVGRVGIVLFLFLVVTTVYLVLSAPATYPDADFAPLAAMVGLHLLNLFNNLLVFALAIAWRRRAFLHKRLMYFVTTGVASPGFSRLPMAFGGEENGLVGVLVAVCFLGVVFAFDWKRHLGWRRWLMPICLAFLLATGVLFGAVLEPFVFASESWLAWLRALNSL